MAASGDIISENDEVAGQIKSILCQPCLKKVQQNKAEIFCSTCDEFQCTDCSEVHYTHTIMKGHNIVNALEAEMKQVSFDIKGLDQCKQHDKTLESFCKDDNQLCCNTCVRVDHGKCNSVVDIKEVVGKSGSESSRLKVKLLKVKEEAKVIISNIVSAKEKLDQDVKEIQIKIRRMRDEVIKMFDELEASVAKDAESVQIETLEKLTKKQLQNERYLADIQSCLEQIDYVYQNGSSVQQFIVEQTIEKQVNALQTNVDAECQSLETFTVMFDFNETLKLPPLPIIEYVPGKLTLKSHRSESASATSPAVTQIKLKPLICIDLKQDVEDKEEPLYSGIDFLPDGRLVAVDNENKKCLLYNRMLEKVGSLQLSYRPKSVVAVSEKKVAITSGSSFTLAFLRVNESNDLIVEKTYIVTTRYNSICLKESEHFVVGTIDHSTPVRILSFTIEEKDFNTNFLNKKYQRDESACTCINHSDKIVITDRNEDTVYIYDIKTNTRVVVKDDQIKEPCDVVIGPSDTILICSENTNSLVQISQTGQILSSYKIDMKYPSRICISRDKSFLAVTNACTGEGKLQKFRILC